MEDNVEKLYTILKDKDLKKFRFENGDSICHIAAEYGKKDIFIKYSSGDVVETCFTNKKSGDTWLHTAARCGHFEIGKYIVEQFRNQVLEFKCNQEDKTAIDMALSSALKNESDPEYSSENVRNHCIDFICSLDKDIVQQLLYGSKTKFRLCNFAALGKTRFIKEFFDYFDKNEKDENDNTPFHIVIRDRHFDTLNEIVKLFKEQKVVLESEDSANNLKTLLNSKNSQGETPLHIAMQTADKSTVSFLINEGSDPFAVDGDGKNPLHVLVKSAQINAADTLMIIQEIGCESESDMKEVLLDILQVASKQGNKYYGIVEYLVQKLEVNQLSQGHGDKHTILYDLLCSATENDQQNIKKITDCLTPEYLRATVTGDSKNEEKSDTDKQKVQCSKHEPILHLIAANGLTSLIEGPNFQFIDKCTTDKKGDTVLHTAARNKHYDTLEQFVSTFHGGSKELSSFLNAKDKDGETVLHIAFKHAQHISTIQTLIQKGADLAAQDYVGNTPLHDLVEKAATDENADKYIEVWKVLVDNVVWWWCLKFNAKRPYKSEDIYRIYQRDALYYLRSEVINKQGLSVIQYAAAEGLVRIVKEMIWVEGVFVSESRDGKKVIINVTNFMPELGDSKNVKYRSMTKDEPYVTLTELEQIDLRIPESNTCLLDAILQVEEGNKANDIFQIQPIRQLVRDHWFVHQWWTFIMLVAHLIYMSLYSSYSLDMIIKATVVNETNVSSDEGLKADFNYVIWPFLLLVPYIVPLLTIQRNSERNRRKQIKQRVLRDTNIDIKDIFNWPSVLLSGIVLIIPLLTPLLFCFLTVSALALTDRNSAFFNDTTSFSVIVGWLLTFYWASAFEPVYRFLSALKLIVLKDVMSFLFFYIFVLLAYSYGLYIVMSGIPNLLREFPTLQEVMFELLLVGCGVDSRMSSDVIAEEFEMAGYNPLFFHFLFTSYIIITLVGLLNLVIASMVDSYQKFNETDNHGWLQHSLKMSHNSVASYAICSLIFQPLFSPKFLNIIDRNVREETHKDLISNSGDTDTKGEIELDFKTGHFIIEMNSKQAHNMIEKLSAGK